MNIAIVGGSRGIGAATALVAAEYGANVGIIYRSAAEQAAAVAEAVQARGGVACTVQADASKKVEITAALAEVSRCLGGIDGVVVSAGIFEGSLIGEMTEDFWDRTMEINLKATFLSVQAALPHIDTGSIVIVTSTAGQRGSAVFSAYATSKGAQIMFMRSMALELAPKIRVNCVAPGWTETDMADASLTELGRESVASGFPLGRIGQADDVAKAIWFLMSPDSAFITGTTLTVDGGSDMRG